MEPKIVRYQDLRDTLGSGDIVTWKGEDPLSLAIQGLRPGGCHTSVILRVGNSIFLAEALTWGFTLNLASERFDRSEKTILIHRLPLTDAQRDHATRIIMVMLARRIRYAWRSLFALAWRQVKFRMGRSVCSQDGQFVLSEIGYLPELDVILSPGELATRLPDPVQLAPYVREEA